ncbi:hypothetical protein PYW07_012515 [Mythimna separata]|uniref:Uncharacterized protein n=1 Tax=Mythimna separata TaxID=271217 RepID=A0AAD7Y8C2_MYTSE|nr:hypothetical protein PYW07_012515 [Mythimna separata]
MVHLPQIREEHQNYISELARYSNEVTTTFKEAGSDSENKAVTELCLRGLQLLSSWCSVLTELCSWKLLHPTDHASNPRCPPDAEEYERQQVAPAAVVLVLRADRAVLVEAAAPHRPRQQPALSARRRGVRAGESLAADVSSRWLQLLSSWCSVLTELCSWKLLHPTDHASNPRCPPDAEEYERQQVAPAAVVLVLRADRAVLVEAAAPHRPRQQPALSARRRGVRAGESLAADVSSRWLQLLSSWCSVLTELCSWKLLHPTDHASNPRCPPDAEEYERQQVAPAAVVLVLRADRAVLVEAAAPHRPRQQPALSARRRGVRAGESLAADVSSRWLQLLSSWCSVLTELCSWKLLHPTDHASNPRCPPDAEEYERQQVAPAAVVLVLRADRAVLVEAAAPHRPRQQPALSARRRGVRAGESLAADVSSRWLQLLSSWCSVLTELCSWKLLHPTDHASNPRCPPDAEEYERQQVAPAAVVLVLRADRAVLVEAAAPHRPRQQPALSARRRGVRAGESLAADVSSRWLQLLSSWCSVLTELCSWKLLHPTDHASNPRCPPDAEEYERQQVAPAAVVLVLRADRAVLVEAAAPHRPRQQPALSARRRGVRAGESLAADVSSRWLQLLSSWCSVLTELCSWKLLHPTDHASNPRCPPDAEEYERQQVAPAAVVLVLRADRAVLVEAAAPHRPRQQPALSARRRGVRAGESLAADVSSRWLQLLSSWCSVLTELCSWKLLHPTDHASNPRCPPDAEEYERQQVAPAAVVLVLRADRAVLVEAAAPHRPRQQPALSARRRGVRAGESLAADVSSRWLQLLSSWCSVLTELCSWKLLHPTDHASNPRCPPDAEEYERQQVAPAAVVLVLRADRAVLVEAAAPHRPRQQPALSARRRGVRAGESLAADVSSRWLQLLSSWCSVLTELCSWKLLHPTDHASNPRCPPDAEEYERQQVAPAAVVLVLRADRAVLVEAAAPHRPRQQPALSARRRGVRAGESLAADVSSRWLQLLSSWCSVLTELCSWKLLHPTDHASNPRCPPDAEEYERQQVAPAAVVLVLRADRAVLVEAAAPHRPRQQPALSARRRGVRAGESLAADVSSRWLQLLSSWCSVLTELCSWKLLHPTDHASNPRCPPDAEEYERQQVAPAAVVLVLRADRAVLVEAAAPHRPRQQPALSARRRGVRAGESLAADVSSRWLQLLSSWCSVLTELCSWKLLHPTDHASNPRCPPDAEEYERQQVAPAAVVLVLRADRAVLVEAAAPHRPRQQPALSARRRGVRAGESLAADVSSRWLQLLSSWCSVLTELCSWKLLHPTDHASNPRCPPDAEEYERQQVAPAAVVLVLRADRAVLVEAAAPHRPRQQPALSARRRGVRAGESLAADVSSRWLQLLSSWCSVLTELCSWKLLHPTDHASNPRCPPDAEEYERQQVAPAAVVLVLRADRAVLVEAAAPHRPRQQPALSARRRGVRAGESLAADVSSRWLQLLSSWCSVLTELCSWKLLHPTDHASNPRCPPDAEEYERQQVAPAAVVLVLRADRAVLVEAAAPHRPRQQPALSARRRGVRAGESLAADVSSRWLQLLSSWCSVLTELCSWKLLHPTDHASNPRCPPDAEEYERQQVAPAAVVLVLRADRAVLVEAAAPHRPRQQPALSARRRGVRAGESLAADVSSRWLQLLSSWCSVLTELCSWKLLHPTDHASNPRCPPDAEEYERQQVAPAAVVLVLRADRAVLVEAAAPHRPRQQPALSARRRGVRAGESLAADVSSRWLQLLSSWCSVLTELCSWKLLHPTDHASNPRCPPDAEEYERQQVAPAAVVLVLRADRAVLVEAAAPHRPRQQPALSARRRGVRAGESLAADVSSRWLQLLSSWCSVLTELCSWKLLHPTDHASNPRCPPDAEEYERQQVAPAAVVLVLRADRAVLVEAAAPHRPRQQPALSARRRGVRAGESLAADVSSRWLQLLSSWCSVLTELCSWKLLHPTDHASNPRCPPDAEEYERQQVAPAAVVLVLRADRAVLVEAAAPHRPRQQPALSARRRGVRAGESLAADVSSRWLQLLSSWCSVLTELCSWKLLHPTDHASNPRCPPDAEEYERQQVAPAAVVLVLRADRAVLVEAAAPHRPRQQPALSARRRGVRAGESLAADVSSRWLQLLSSWCSVLTELCSWKLLHPTDHASNPRCPPDAEEYERQQVAPAAVVLVLRADRAVLVEAAAPHRPRQQPALSARRRGVRAGESLAADVSSRWLQLLSSWCSVLTELCSWKLLHPTDHASNPRCPPDAEEYERQQVAPAAVVLVLRADRAVLVEAAAPHRPRQQPALSARRRGVRAGESLAADVSSRWLQLLSSWCSVLTELCSWKLLHPTDHASNPRCPPDAEEYERQQVAPAAVVLVLRADRAVLVEAAAPHRPRQQPALSARRRGVRAGESLAADVSSRWLQLLSSWCSVLTELCSWKLLHPTDHASNPRCPPDAEEYERQQVAPAAVVLVLRADRAVLVEAAAPHRPRQQPALSARRRGVRAGESLAADVSSRWLQLLSSWCSVLTELCSWKLLHPTDHASNPRCPPDAEEYERQQVAPAAVVLVLRADRAVLVEAAAPHRPRQQPALSARRRGVRAGESLAADVSSRWLQLLSSWCSVLTELCSWKLLHPTDHASNPRCPPDAEEYERQQVAPAAVVLVLRADRAVLVEAAAPHRPRQQPALSARRRGVRAGESLAADVSSRWLQLLSSWCSVLTELCSWKLLHPTDHASNPRCPPDAEEYERQQVAPAAVVLVLRADRAVLVEAAAPHRPRQQPALSARRRGVRAGESLAADVSSRWLQLLSSWCSVLTELCSWKLLHPTDHASNPRCPPDAEEYERQQVAPAAVVLVLRADRAVLVEAAAPHRPRQQPALSARRRGVRAGESLAADVSSRWLQLLSSWCSVLTELCSWKLLHPTDHASNPRCPPDAEEYERQPALSARRRGVRAGESLAADVSSRWLQLLSSWCSVLTELCSWKLLHPTDHASNPRCPPDAEEYERQQVAPAAVVLVLRADRAVLVEAAAPHRPRQQPALSARRRGVRAGESLAADVSSRWLQLLSSWCSVLTELCSWKLLHPTDHASNPRCPPDAEEYERQQVAPAAVVLVLRADRAVLVEAAAPHRPRQQPALSARRRGVRAGESLAADVSSRWLQLLSSWCSVLTELCSWKLLHPTDHASNPRCPPDAEEYERQQVAPAAVVLVLRADRAVLVEAAAPHRPRQQPALSARRRGVRAGESLAADVSSRWLQLLSSWCSVLTELCSWKLLHPTDHASNPRCPPDAEEYERVSR